MSVRLAVALLLALTCSDARAADPWVPFRKAFPGPREPVVVTPLPPVAPQDDALAAIERALAEAEAATKRAEEAAARAEEALRAATPDPKSPVVMLPPRPRQPARAKARPLSIQPSLPGDPDYISCSDARRGVGMECWKVRMGSGEYASYSKKKKANARACMTEAEIAAIESCFGPGQ